LGIPDEIIQRPPTADVYPAMSEDREFYFRLRYEDLDPLLYAWEHHIPIEEVMQEMNLQEEQVRRIYRDFATKRILSEHLQRPPINLGEEFVV
jgi:NAD+ synthase